MYTLSKASDSAWKPETKTPLSVFQSFPNNLMCKKIRLEK